jgi:hypothetical protein
MEEVASTAKLVETIAPDDGHPLTTTVLRSQVAAALEDGGSADLILNVARIHDGKREDRTATISWERPDLEELLSRASGDQIELTFNQDELERMLDSDVEAHGFREKALVLTVAAATAAGMSSAASAKVLMDSSSGISQGAPVSGLVTDTSSSGVPGAISGIVTDASTSGQTGSVSSFITDTGSDRTRTPAEPTTGGGGFSVPDSAVDAALAGGLALLITGAAFITRTQRRRESPA